MKRCARCDLLTPHTHGDQIAEPVPIGGYNPGGYTSGPIAPPCPDNAHTPDEWEHVIKINPTRIGPAEFRMCKDCWRIVDTRLCEHTGSEQQQILHDVLGKVNS